MQIIIYSVSGIIAYRMCVCVCVFVSSWSILNIISEIKYVSLPFFFYHGFGCVDVNMNYSLTLFTMMNMNPWWTMPMVLWSVLNASHTHTHVPDFSAHTQLFIHIIYTDTNKKRERETHIEKEENKNESLIVVQTKFIAVK